jgi:hypothetical protein
MSTLNYGDVIEVSPDDCKQSSLILLDTVGFTATSWPEFSQASLHLELNAEFRSENSKIAVYLRDAFLLANARGEALTKLAASHYLIDRNLADEAEVLVTLTCDATGGPHSIDLGELTLTHLDSGQTYRNIETSGVTYPHTLSTSTSITLRFQAEVAGSAANVADLVGIENNRLNLDTTLDGVSITSYALDISGVDEESDDRLKERCSLKWVRTQGVGNTNEKIQAIAYEAAPAVTTVAVDDTNPRGAGTFDVYIAGLDATASTEDVVDVQVAVDLQTFGSTATPKTAQVYAAPEVPLAISGILYFSGATKTAVDEAVETALTAFIRSIPGGGFSYFPGPQHTVQKNDIESVIREAAIEAGATRATVVLTTPTGDTTVALHGKVVAGARNITTTLMNV